MSFQKKLFLKLLKICVLICWTAMYITDRTPRSRTPVWNVGISKDYLTPHPHPAKGFNKLSPTCLGESVLEHSQSRMMQLIASMCQIKLLFLYSSVLSFERILFGWSWGRLLDKLCWHGSVLPTRSVRSVLRLCVCVWHHIRSYIVAAVKSSLFRFCCHGSRNKQRFARQQFTQNVWCLQIFWRHAVRSF